MGVLDTMYCAGQGSKNCLEVGPASTHTGKHPHSIAVSLIVQQ